MPYRSVAKQRSSRRRPTASIIGVMSPASSHRSRQPRAMATRATIVRGAAKAYVKYGYAASTLAVIGKETKTSNGAFYFHFASREAVAQAVIDEYDATVRSIVSRESERERSALVMLFAISFAFVRAIQRDVVVQAGLILTTERSDLPKSVTNAAYMTWAAQIASVLKSAQEVGEISSDCDTQALGEFLVATFTGSQLFSSFATNRRDLGDRIHAGWSIVLPSIVPRDKIDAVKAMLDDAREGTV